MMHPTYLREQIDRMQAQIRDETDPELKRLERKTVRHLHKQYREATRHRKPWFGLKANSIFLGLLFIALCAVCVWAEKTFGIAVTLSSIAATAGVLVLVTAIVFLVMKLISPEQYQSLVSTVFGHFRNLTGPHVGNLDAGASEVLELRQQGTELPQLPRSDMRDSNSSED